MDVPMFIIMVVQTFLMVLVWLGIRPGPNPDTDASPDHKKGDDQPND